ncbi:MAG: hypothetical protein K2I14_05310, partial [Eubacterium sp.]|nr:hypothetical protein [Eubacterium sp.]
MKRYKKIIISLMLFSIFFCICACSKTNESRNTAVLPDLISSESEIYVINRENITDSEYSVVSSLQGITAQSSSKIYIEDGGNLAFLEKYLDENKDVTIKRISSVQELIEAGIDDIRDKGFVLFEEGNNPTINMAFTVAGMEGWLAVPLSLRNEAEAMGLEVKLDLTLKENEEYITTQEDIFEKYKDKLNKNLLVHQSPELITLRDYAAAAGAFCFYTDEKDNKQVRFRQKVFEWANENAISFGWSSDELGYVKQASKCSVVVIPSDHCSNLSLLSSLKLKEPISQKNKAEEIIPQQGKHYISLVMSDGDNVQWYETTVPFREHYYDRVTAAEQYKLTWTAPPMMYKLAPTVLQYVYDMAADKDRFVCGVSGMGYINPTKYCKNAMNSFVKDTVDAMQQADLQTITILDNSKSSSKLSKALEPYAAVSSINGGIMQINEKYEALGGKILSVNNKPFISAKKSFWFSSENPDETISKEWIEAFAAEINALPSDIHSEDGYSYINIHPWSTTIEDLNYFVSLLDEHIEIVYADELVDMVSK